MGSRDSASDTLLLRNLSTLVCRKYAHDATRASGDDRNVL